MNNGGTINTPNPNRDGRVVFKAMPSEGQGPFTVTLYATAYWPKYIPYGQCGYQDSGTQNKKVSEFNINWGDGSKEKLDGSQSINQVVQGDDASGSGRPCNYNVPVFKVTHQYAQPPGHNVTETITGKFTEPTGVHTTTFNVNNYWDTPGEIADQGGGETDSHEHPIQPNQMPGAGTFDPKKIPGTQQGPQ